VPDDPPGLTLTLPGTLVASIVVRTELLSEGERIARTGKLEVDVK
jgi:hypothetical protein